MSRTFTDYRNDVAFFHTKVENFRLKKKDGVKNIPKYCLNEFKIVVKDMFSNRKINSTRCII